MPNYTTTGAIINISRMARNMQINHDKMHRLTQDSDKTRCQLGVDGKAIIIQGAPSLSRLPCVHNNQIRILSMSKPSQLLRTFIAGSISRQIFTMIIFIKHVEFKMHIGQQKRYAYTQVDSTLDVQCSDRGFERCQGRLLRVSVRNSEEKQTSNQPTDTTSQ